LIAPARAGGFFRNRYFAPGWRTSLPAAKAPLAGPEGLQASFAAMRGGARPMDRRSVELDF